MGPFIFFIFFPPPCFSSAEPSFATCFTLKYRPARFQRLKLELYCAHTRTHGAASDPLPAERRRQAQALISMQKLVGDMQRGPPMGQPRAAAALSLAHAAASQASVRIRAVATA